MRAATIGILAIVCVASAQHAVAQSLVLTPVESIYDAGAAGPLNAPEGVGCSDAFVVVADAANARLVRFEHDRGLVKNPRVIKLPQLGYPVRVVLRPNGGMVVLDRKSGHLVRVSPGGKPTGTWKPSGIAGGHEVAARAFSIGTNGDFYVLDGATGEVIHTDDRGRLISTIAPPAGSGIMADITADESGNVYGVTNVQRGLWVAKKGAARFEPIKSELAGRLAFATAIALATRLSSLLVVDQHRHTLLSFGLDGAYRGRTLRFGWREGMLRYPGQVCTTQSGQLFIADRQNNRVQVFAVGG